MSAAESPTSNLQTWERYLRGDLESTLQEALRALRATLETRLHQEINAGLANALHDAAPALQQSLQRRIRGWSAQLPPPPPTSDPWPSWLAGLLDARQAPQLLQAVFAAANALAPRLAIFVMRGGAAMHWRAAGFEAPNRVAIEGEEHAFDQVAREGRALVWRGDRPLRQPLPPGFNNSLAGGLHALTVRGKTIALVYYECGNEAPESDLEPRLSALIRVAALALDQIMQGAGGEEVAASASAPAPRPRPVPAPLPAPLPMPAPVETANGRPMTSTEARAQRYAKVLIQDLELYLKRDRPQELSEARSQRALYTRLREDFDKCQQSFREKFPAGSGVPMDILERQMVAILAQGDRDLLGADFPGLS